MSKKHIFISIASFILGALVVYFSSFTVSELKGYAPSYTSPLTDEQFAAAQQKGEAMFNGSPTTEEGDGYRIETVISCRKEISECTSASAVITPYTSGPGLSVELVRYKITEWTDEGKITAVVEPKENDCGVYGLRADVKSREVFVNYKTKEGVNKPTCENSPQDGETKLDFNMSEESDSFLLSLKSDMYYAIGELFN
jgi:hypothetical protein